VDCNAQLTIMASVGVFDFRASLTTQPSSAGMHYKCYIYTRQHTHTVTHTHTHTRQIHRTCLSQYLAHNLVKINSHFCNPASRQADRENGRNSIASFDIYTCSMNTSDCSSTNSYWMQGKADVSPPGCATSHKIGCHGNVPRGIETLISD